MYIDNRGAARVWIKHMSTKEQKYQSPNPLKKNLGFAFYYFLFSWKYIRPQIGPREAVGGNVWGGRIGFALWYLRGIAAQSSSGESW